MNLPLKNVYYIRYVGKVTTGIKDDWLVTVKVTETLTVETKPLDTL